MTITFNEVVLPTQGKVASLSWQFSKLSTEVQKSKSTCAFAIIKGNKKTVKNKNFFISHKVA